MKAFARLLMMMAALLTGTAAHAQGAADFLQRNVDQLVAIQQGLQFGFLTLEEAADFSLRQANIEALEVELLRDGWLGVVDAQRVAREQDGLAALVARSVRTWQVGNPYLPEAQRLMTYLQASIGEQQRLREALRNGQVREQDVGRVLQQQALIDRQVAEQALGAQMQPAPQMEYREYREYREPVIVPSFTLQFGNDRGSIRDRDWLREREFSRQRELLREREDRREREAQHRSQDRRDGRRDDVRQEQRQESRPDRREEFRQDHRAEKPAAVAPVAPIAPAIPVVPRQQVERQQTPVSPPAAQTEQREQRNRSKERGNDDDERRRGGRGQINER
jgi:hypothetical protein